MGTCRQDFFIASLYLNTPAKIVPSQEVYTRFGAIDLLAPPAGKDNFIFSCYNFFHDVCCSVPHRNTGLPNLQESYVGTLFPRSVHNGPSSRIYNVYIHTVCVYSRVFFAIFYDFYGFLRFLWIFWVFYWIFYFSF